MRSSAAGADASAAPAAATGDNDDPLVQYVVLRRDLWTDLGWPLGSIVAQACASYTSQRIDTYFSCQQRDSDEEATCDSSGEALTASELCGRRVMRRRRRCGRAATATQPTGTALRSGWITCER